MKLHKRSHATSHIYDLSISYIYKVFEHIKMLWVGIWVHPYTVMPVQVGVDGGCLENWGMAEPE